VTAATDPVSEQSLNIKFDGRLHEVEITAFTRVLLDFTEVVKAANRQSETNANVDVRITATGEGSFETLIKLVLSNAEGALPYLQAGQIAVEGVAALAVGAYKLHHWLSKRKIAHQLPTPSADEVSITDVAGDSITVNGDIYNMYFGEHGVPEAISRSFAALDDDSAITGFEIMDHERSPLFQAERAEFGPMAVVSPAALALETTTTEVVDAELRIVKLVLERSYTRKWEFFWAGIKISANITDESFFDRIDSGLSFAKGDALQVRLEITREWDEAMGVSWNKSYSIIEVDHHVPRSQSQPLF